MADASTVNKPVQAPLRGKLVAVPESRQLDILAQLIENRGGEALRVPLVSIHDSPDTDVVERWINGFITQRPDLFVVFTGEGLRRLLGFAERAGLVNEFVQALSSTPLLVRGPKPQRVLTELGIKAEYSAASPTTAGVIETLDGIDVEGRAIAVQLYGEELNQPLQDYLNGRRALLTTVAPYIYASDAETIQVALFINRLAKGDIDIITFTSQPQLRRLQQVAASEGLEAELVRGLGKTVLAAVGPVVRAQIEEAGYRVSIMPERQYFMKPLVTAMVRYVEQDLP